MSAKKTVVLLFGGRSSEHEISCVTATGILGALDRELFDVITVGITKQGAYVHLNESDVNFKLDSAAMPQVPQGGARVLWPDSTASRELRLLDESGQITSLGEIDVVFPVLHGPYGEDGTVQGMLELLGVPYVGSGVLASAACMDKHVTKTMLSGSGIAVAPWNYLTKTQYDALAGDYAKLDKGLNYPLFIKPARAGSSVGVSRVTEPAGLAEALRVAFLEDSAVLVESAVQGREVEIAVLEGFGAEPASVSSVIGEIVFQGKDFYDYEAKYLGSNGVRLQLPATVSDAQLAALQKAALTAFEVMQCRGPARVDFFLTETGPVLNEINTMPGFTPISMYPALWQHSGIAYDQLVTKLIMLALQ